MKETEEMKTKSKIMAVLLVAVAALTVCFATVAFTGCGATTINISGSTSVSPLMEKLVDAYNEDHDVTINVTESGSSAGVTDAINGTVDFGMASRLLTDEETKSGVTETKIADDGIALIVHKNCTVTNVTMQEVYNMYASRTPIQTVITTAYGREAGSGTRGAFDELIANTNGDTLDELTNGYAEGIDMFNGTNLVKESVAGNQSSIGYISMGSVDDTIKTVSFEGVAATTANVSNGSYKLSRPFNLVIPEGGLTDAAQDFVDFILSDEGQAIVTAEGYISI